MEVSQRNTTMKYEEQGHVKRYTKTLFQRRLNLFAILSNIEVFA